MKGPQNTLFHRVSKAGLLDSTMERFRAGETLAAVAAWLTEQGIQTDIAQTHRFKKGHYDDWTFEKAGIDIKSEDTNDINLDTIKRLSVILNQELSQLSLLHHFSISHLWLLTSPTPKRHGRFGFQLILFKAITRFI